MVCIILLNYFAASLMILILRGFLVNINHQYSIIISPQKINHSLKLSKAVNLNQRIYLLKPILHEIFVENNNMDTGTDYRHG